MTPAGDPRSRLRLGRHAARHPHSRPARLPGAAPRSAARCSPGAGRSPPSARPWPCSPPSRPPGAGRRRRSPVLVAAHDLPGGSPVAGGDLVAREYAEGTQPSGTVTDPHAAVGRVLAAPLREGEPLTDVRLVGPGLLDGYPGPRGDPGAGRRRRRGPPPRGGRPRRPRRRRTPSRARPAGSPSGAPVVAVPEARASGAGFQSGALVVVAVSPAESLALARAAGAAILSLVLSG